MATEGKLRASGVGTSRWALYDKLIAGVPGDVLVRDYALGTKWTYVEAECGMGVGWTHPGGAKRVCKEDLRARSLKEVAGLSKSWSFEEATIGIAALNAWYSRRELVEPLGATFGEDMSLPQRDDASRGKRSGMSVSTFEKYRPQVEALDNPRVVVVGHFPNSEAIDEYAQVIILERNCRDGWDTPDPACEYVLPEADFAFITGVTFINKTVTRLLELSANARTIMVGPSVVMSPLLFEQGVEELAGSMVADPELVRFAVKNGTGKLFGGPLEMCSLTSAALA